jgi:hypothetical protein
MRFAGIVSSVVSDAGYAVVLLDGDLGARLVPAHARGNVQVDEEARRVA